MARRIVDSSRARYRKMQLRLMRGLERKFKRMFAKEIRRASLSMLEDYEATGGAMVSDEMHARNIASIYKALGVSVVDVFGSRILESGKAAGYTLEAKGAYRELFERLARDYIAGEAIRRRITSISDTTRAQIVSMISAGSGEGLGAEDVARTIRKRINTISAFRAATIARTEVSGAASYASDGAARAMGMEMEKTWLATEDDRSRQWHIEADGQTVDMDQPFIVGGEAMMYPGDASASAANTINCRCVVDYAVK